MCFAFDARPPAVPADLLPPIAGGSQFAPLRPFAQKEPQRLNHRLGRAARSTMIAVWPFNPVDQTGHKAACRRSHHPLPCQSHGKAGRMRHFQQPS